MQNGTMSGALCFASLELRQAGASVRIKAAVRVEITEIGQIRFYHLVKSLQEADPRQGLPLMTPTKN